MEEYQEITKKEFEGILKKLYKGYPSLLDAIHFDTEDDTVFSSSEMICGFISEKIVAFLQKLGVKEAHYIHGTYCGRGTEFSGGDNGTGHCWVELRLKLKDKNEEQFKVIIDGAYAQFFPFDLTPRIVRNAQRLMIFIDDKKAEEWYQTKGETKVINGKVEW